MRFGERCTKLLVCNIQGETEPAALREWLEQVAPVADLRIEQGIGKALNRRFAFAEVATPEDARAMIEKLNGAPFRGRPLRVYPAPQRPEMGRAHDPALIT